ncbi:hypothetical protein DVK85_12190 [Flavobacterium arcticum]|uniref:Gliding motility-associated C-terminal domain-containing protein n=1 Tax=Flavobacterium arcticum TaxID=1784713 RepID=A0A345HED6_9FLAO|nr:gliding motility-associated C-terminal domain-containing protein [Flavobacterium arcticum]AXG74946.1 hypothetical protein DVK85_12190 [Flavobacterium arcticum]KAF2506499.1 T9SS type B sorting domain-containing protein [Flavobacterium arcticum]
MNQKLSYLILLLLIVFSGYTQDIALYEQFNGRYDFTFVGNTLNPAENNPTAACNIYTTSSANLNLDSNDSVVAAYLYWAGSGTGDFDIELNGTPVTAERDFPLSALNTDGLTRNYFSAFADVTAQVQTTGNGVYTVSELDLTAVIQDPLYCNIKTNFGGWAIIVFYYNPNLPLNQVNLYDGLEYVPPFINVILPSLNVIDNEGAKIGFLAWEGDASLAVTETLSINGTPLSNDLNPVNNAFNGTNTVTGSSTMYNMDLDIYDIQDNIAIGDATAEITLQSGQDFVMVNAIVTKLNSQLPDATIEINTITQECNSGSISLDYTVYNVNSTEFLPAGTPIAFYINGDFVAGTTTMGDIPIGDNESGIIIINIPAGTPIDYEILVVVDDVGDGTGGIVTETDETNNSVIINETQHVSPPLQQPEDITVCETDNGTNIGVFDFSEYIESLKNNTTDIVTFHTSLTDAIDNVDAIDNPENYTSNGMNPQTIYVRLENENGCFTTGEFNLIAIDCLFPDGTVSLGDIGKSCNSRVITVQYTINNFNSFDVLPSGTPISIYANGEFLDYTETLLDIAIGGIESGSITLTIPDDVPLDFELSFVVDDIGNGTGIVTEIDETNNNTLIPLSLIVSTDLHEVASVIVCDEGFGIGTFDFSDYEESLKNIPTDMVYFYTTATDANQDSNRIYNTTTFVSTSNPQEIFVRVDNGICYNTTSFLLYTKKCPPTTFNYVTPNNDGYNDTFFVEGLRNIFLNFKMSIYNRWGSLVWTGNHSKEDWNGIANVEKIGPEGNTVPVGTYYFVLELNDPDYPEPIVGWVYVSK